jgi:dipeptidyl aminopeptidase/acylaminoacyl peptidase
MAKQIIIRRDCESQLKLGGIIGGLFSILILLADAASTAIAAETPKNEFVSPGENLVTEGIPRIPIQLADALRPYTEFRGALMCDWHPIHRQMLITTQFANTMQIHEVKFPGGARTQLTFFREPVWQATYQPTKGDFFVFARDTGGNENFQKYRYDASTYAVTLLTDGKFRNTDGVWSHAGDRFVYGSTRRTGQNVDLWIVDPSDPKSNRMLIALAGGGWVPLDFSPDDCQLLIINQISANESYLSLVEVATGRMSRLTPPDGATPIAYGTSQFSRDGAKIYCTTDRDSEFHRLASIDLRNKKHHYLTSDINWDISEFSLSWDGKRIAFVSNEDGRDVLHVLDATTSRELAKPDLPIGLFRGFQWHKNNRDLGYTFVDSRRGADAYSLDTTSNKPTRWTFSETGGIKTDDFKASELVHWKSFDGRTLSGWLNRPPAKFTGKRPVIIQIHGGPEGQARPWIGSGNRYIVNELGVAFLQPNIRGSLGYGKTFVALDDGFKREDAYKDIGSLLDWLKTRDDLDADRIMVMGGSYGGHMTLATSTYYADHIRCAIDIVGQSNLATFLDHTSEYRKDLRRVEYGDERDPKMRAFLNRTAPLTNAAKITKPLFVVQGQNDPRVPLSEAEQLIKRVRQNGTPVWYLLAKDEGHGFAKKQNEDFLFYATVMFLQKYLLN